MKSTLKILCLEDLEEDFEIINRTLKRNGLDVVSKRVDSREEFLTALDKYRPDVILSDHSLPQFNSIEALRLCQEHGNRIPFILVTGAVSDEFAVNCIKRGADDYVLKSNLSRLPSAIENAIRHKETEDAKLRATTALAAQNNDLIKINKELDSFIYSVSHNLRAPLMSVLGLLTLTKVETNKDTVDQYHELMEKSIHKLDDTLKEILEYSRNARQELVIEPIDLKKVIAENLDKMQFMPGFQKLRIGVKVKDATPFYSDYYRISVILNNLISNAIKYLDQYKEQSWLNIVINVDESTAVLEFSDNGIGIDNRLIHKIYDMFFRATSEKEGSGLGLFIVKEAIDKLEGKISIDSEVGKGTSFHITLPNLRTRLQGNV